MNGLGFLAQTLAPTPPPASQCQVAARLAVAQSVPDILTFSFLQVGGLGFLVQTLALNLPPARQRQVAAREAWTADRGPSRGGDIP